MLCSRCWTSKMRMFQSLWTLQKDEMQKQTLITILKLWFLVYWIFPKWKRLSRRHQQELSNYSVTERPDKLGLCCKRTERLKNIQQTAVSEQPNQATKTIQSTWWGGVEDRWCWWIYSVLIFLWTCGKLPNSGFPTLWRKKSRLSY